MAFGLAPNFLKLAFGLAVTTSIGVACSDDETDAGKLLRAADDAAYASKFTGKNRITTWPLDAALARQVAESRSTAKGR